MALCKAIIYVLKVYIFKKFIPFQKIAVYHSTVQSDINHPADQKQQFH